MSLCVLYVCVVSVCTPPPFFDTTVWLQPNLARILCGLIRESFGPNTIWPTTGPGGGVNNSTKVREMSWTAEKIDTFFFLSPMGRSTFQSNLKHQVLKSISGMQLSWMITQNTGRSRLIRGWREGGADGREGGRKCGQAGTGRGRQEGVEGPERSLVTS